MAVTLISTDQQFMHSSHALELPEQNRTDKSCSARAVVPEPESKLESKLESKPTEPTRSAEPLPLPVVSCASVIRANLN